MSGIGNAALAAESIRDTVVHAYNFTPDYYPAPSDPIDASVVVSSNATSAAKPRSTRTLILNRPPTGNDELHTVAHLGRKCDFVKFNDTQQVFPIYNTPGPHR